MLQVTVAAIFLGLTHATVGLPGLARLSVTLALDAQPIEFCYKGISLPICLFSILLALSDFLMLSNV